MKIKLKLQGFLGRAAEYAPVHIGGGPGGEQISRKEPGCPSAYEVDHELATGPCSKGSLRASWAALDRELPAGQWR